MEGVTIRPGCGFKKIFSLLFLLFNFICLLTLFSYPGRNVQLLLQLRLPLLLNSNPSLKPWPNLPSYLPWSSYGINSSSCEAIFGNGFKQTINVLPRSKLPSVPRIRNHSPSSGWFRCHFNPTLRSSICEGGGIRMDPNKIRMSKGGEPVEEVIGRKEEVELPVFEDGAFKIQGEVFGGYGGLKRLVNVTFLEKYLPQGHISKHKMRELVRSIELVEDNLKLNCSQWIEEPTLFVTRFEYANLYHTYTDLYNAYVSSRVTGLPGRPNVIFVDGHCKTRLEETWEALFSSVRFAKNFSSPVCFRHAIFVPLGYEMQWFRGLFNRTTICYGTSAEHLFANPDDQKTARVIEFGEMVKAAFGISLDDQPLSTKPPLGNTNVINVLFVRRENYLAHPRQKGNIKSRVRNEQVVLDELKVWASNYSKCQVNITNGFFARMPMKDQIQAVQNASVVIGGHGAGLAHIITASPNKTALFEIRRMEFYKSPHFELITQWKGVEYHPLTVRTSNDIIELLLRILHNIGC